VVTPLKLRTPFTHNYNNKLCGRVIDRHGDEDDDHDDDDDDDDDLA